MTSGVEKRAAQSPAAVDPINLRCGSILSFVG